MCASLQGAQASEGGGKWGCGSSCQAGGGGPCRRLSAGTHRLGAQLLCQPSDSLVVSEDEHNVGALPLLVGLCAQVRARSKILQCSISPEGYRIVRQSAQAAGAHKAQ